MESAAQGDQRAHRPRGILAWLNAHPPPEMTILMGLALLVGIGAGLGAIAFQWLINNIQTIFFGGGSRALGFLGPYYVLLVPAAGGLLVGPLVFRFAREAKGHGVPEVMEAVALRGGRIRPVVVVVKALASSICIGSGGAAGREGPIVQIGSALGSTLGQFLKMSEGRIRMLVACGAAGGISATFNAPVAGVLFALEVILGEFAASHFSTVVIASVTAGTLARVFHGNFPAFVVPAYRLVTPWELFFYAILGILGALVSTLFVQLLYRTEDLFEAWSFPEYLKASVGGLGVGTIGLVAPEVFGVGYETIEAALHNELLVGGTLLLLVAKLLATSLTLGSGGSGGVFAPSLFLGAMLGGSVGSLVHAWFPGLTAEPGAYALVGMAAVFAGAARAPISAVIILFEMTGDYRIILPLMLATVVSTVLAGHLQKESIYTLKLARRGTRIRYGRDVDIMEGLKISEVMNDGPPTVDSSLTIQHLSRHFRQNQRQASPVLENGQLIGMVSLQDLEQGLSREEGSRLTVADIATRSPVTVFPDESAGAALRKMAPRDLSSLPVVSRMMPARLLGTVRRNDIVRAYNLATMNRQKIDRKMDQVKAGKGSQARFVELTVGAGSPVTEGPLASLELPEKSVLVSVRRGEQVEFPRGGTRLAAGDQVTVFVGLQDEEALRLAFLRAER